MLGLARPAYLSNLEAGRKLPSIDLVKRIAMYFLVTTDYLLLDSWPIQIPQLYVEQQVHQPKDAQSDFAAKLRYLRVQRGVRQAELAHQLGLRQQGYLSNLEAHRKQPSLVLVLRVAEYFGVTTDYVLRDTVPTVAVEYRESAA